MFELSNGKIKILTLRYLLLYKHLNKSIKYNFVKRKWVNRMKNRIFCKSLVAGMVSFSLMLGQIVPTFGAVQDKESVRKYYYYQDVLRDAKSKASKVAKKRQLMKKYQVSRQKSIPMSMVPLLRILMTKPVIWLVERLTVKMLYSFHMIVPVI